MGNIFINWRSDSFVTSMNWLLFIWNEKKYFLSIQTKWGLRTEDLFLIKHRKMKFLFFFPGRKKRIIGKYYEGSPKQVLSPHSSGWFLISMTVMEVCHYGKFDIEFLFHRFLPFPNFFVSYGNFLREIVSFHYLLNVLN